MPDRSVAEWWPWKLHWRIRPGAVYLNHGSFGPPPRPVQEQRAAWQQRLDSEPMDFFVREMEPALDRAAERLAAFVGAQPGDLAFVDNATAAMNVVADSFPRAAGDEVLFTDHEYGAVRRIWQRACGRQGAVLRIQPLPWPLADREAVVDALLGGITPRTRLLVVSQITSPTAVILPVAEITRRAREKGVAVCVDGPHALGILDLKLRDMDCDYFAASCHKWLCAPFGSGFLYVHPRRQQALKPPVMSWGGSIGGHAPRWQDEFHWVGTRDPSPWLTIPDAIDFLAACGWERFRTRVHDLARYARGLLEEITGWPAIVPDDELWYGSMTCVPLPQPREAPPGGQRDPLQNRLWEEYRIEVPVNWWQGRRLLRVSCHLYNQPEEIDRLARALGELLADESRSPA